MIRAGDLDRIITIERATPTLSKSRARSQTWAPLATMRAKLVSGANDRALRSGGAADDATYIFQTRWIDGVTFEDRVSYCGQPFSIKSVVEIGRRVGLEFRCEALRS